MVIEQAGIYQAELPASIAVSLVVVVQTDLLNRLETHDKVMVVPLTGDHLSGSTHALIEPSRANGLERRHWAVTTEIHTIDKSQLSGKIGKLEKPDLHAVQQKLKVSLRLA